MIPQGACQSCPWAFLLGACCCPRPPRCVRTGAAYLLVDAAIILDCGFLTALFAPLLAGLNAILGAVDGDDERHFPTAAQG
jgi:hypothetical protein